MTRPSLNLANLPAAMHKPMEIFAHRLIELAGENILALTFFGPITTPLFDIKHDHAQSVMVLNSLDLPMLRKLAKYGPEFKKARIAAPLIMTPPYIQGSLDTFPLELLEIHQFHRTVIGNEYFATLSFDPSYLQLQCARELKTVLIAMRQGLLASTGRDNILNIIEHDITIRLLRILRGILWLNNHRESLSPDETTTQLEAQLNRPFPYLHQAFSTVSSHGWEEFQGLYQEVNFFLEHVDAL